MSLLLGTWEPFECWSAGGWWWLHCKTYHSKSWNRGGKTNSSHLSDDYQNEATQSLIGYIRSDSQHHFLFSSSSSSRSLASRRLNKTYQSKCCTWMLPLQIFWVKCSLPQTFSSYIYLRAILTIMMNNPLVLYWSLGKLHGWLWKVTALL